MQQNLSYQEEYNLLQTLLQVIAFCGTIVQISDSNQLSCPELHGSEKLWLLYTEGVSSHGNTVLRSPWVNHSWQTNESS